MNTPMNYSTTRKISLVLFVLLFIVPFLALLISLQSSGETERYYGLGILLAGYYNYPYLLASSVALLFAGIFHKEQFGFDGIAKACLLISIGSSIIGITRIVLIFF